MIDRRTLIKSGTAAGLAAIVHPALAAGRNAALRVRRECPDTAKTRLAVQELHSGVVALGLAPGIIESPDRVPGLELVLSIVPALGGESYEITRAGEAVLLRAASEQALLHAVFDLLERQGAVFGLDGMTTPPERAKGWTLPENGRPWRATPAFATRGLLPWPDFLNCISVFNQEDFRAYFAAMLRMRLNLFGMHVYTDTLQPTESYLSVRFAGAGQQAELETTATRGWGYLPQRTSTYGMGSAALFDRETFGSDAARLAADNWEVADRTTALLRDGLSFARDLGIRTGIGFEPYKLPAAIGEALPPEARSHPAGFTESATAKRLLEARLADLLERYPMVDHVWLWEDETSNWDSRAKDVPISTTAFVQAHDFLRRHAPEKRLVVAGWGGFARHFTHLHRSLPGDIVFSALGDTLGWDPVSEAFGALGDRERWPIPWLEDDPSMWFPQFRASTVERDMHRARSLGCQGMLGIHWRHRIVDPTATYFARAGWDASLSTRTHYARFARAQASSARAPKLAELMLDCDTGGAIASTFTGKTTPDGHAGHAELSADYQDAFKYRENTPDPAMLVRQRRTAARFEALARLADSALERERLGYLAGFVKFMVPYCDAYTNAHALDAVLVRADALRKVGDMAGAQALIRAEGLSLWLALLPQVRTAVLDFQAVIATRNDLGQLASMQNKLVRIAVERLKLSLEEFLGELPEEATQAYVAALAPPAPTPRLFLPTRPSILRAGEKLRLFVVAPGVAPGTPITLLHRGLGQPEWSRSAAVHEGRAVHSVALGPFDVAPGVLEYRVEAQDAQGPISDPPAGGAYHAALFA
ncbi:MAG: hypothetical protein WC729_11615 [Sphingomonas sp.]|jgi:hypothetical protein|uniref:hypothetical protein n=1 Tax=Sphingomonas sp. TaxID=28214 RepID=UPI00356454DC